jgi:hypothetical protein
LHIAEAREQRTGKSLGSTDSRMTGIQVAPGLASNKLRIRAAACKRAPDP